MLSRATRLDAEEALAATVESLADLRPWMDWAVNFDTSLEAYTEHLVEVEGTWENDTDYDFIIRAANDSLVLGRCSLMRRVGPQAIEVGYWVRSGFHGRGIATEAATLLAEAGLALPDVDQVELHHDAANVASGKVAAKAGFVELERRLVEIDASPETGVEVVWELTR